MNRRILSIFGILLVIGYVVFGLSRLRFDAEISRMLPEDLKESDGTRLFLDHYSRQGEMLVTLEADEAEVADEAVKSLSELFREQEESVRSVVVGSSMEGDDGGDEIMEFVAWTLINRPSEELKELEQSLAPGAVEEKLEAAMKRLTEELPSRDFAVTGNDPLGFLEQLLSNSSSALGDDFSYGTSEGAFRVFFVAARDPDGSYRDKIAWIEEMWEVVGRWRESRDAGAPEVKVGLTGEPAFVAEIAGGMERDMRNSGIFTLIAIGLIFWVAYRRIRPLLDLVLALVVIFLLTLATGGVIFQDLSAISIGFASILIGLTVDYGVILFQEARAPGTNVASIRRSAGKGIIWASLTTAAAFVSLSAGKVPGLAELGVLVGSGVLLGAVVMFFGFAHRAVAAGRRENRKRKEIGGEDHIQKPVSEKVLRRRNRISLGAAIVTAFVMAGLLVSLVILGVPDIDPSPSAMRPRNSKSGATMKRFSEKMGSAKGIVHVVAAGSNLKSVRGHIEAAEKKLQELKKGGLIRYYRIPTDTWPDPEVQKENLLGAGASLISSADRLRKALDDAGFEEAAFDIAGAILKRWGQWHQEGEFPLWPETYSAKRMASRFIGWETDEKDDDQDESIRAIGALRPTEPGNAEQLLEIRKAMDLDGVFLSGGSVLSSGLAEVVPNSIWRILVVLSVLVLIALILAFRRAREVILTAASVGLTIGAMLGAMQLLGVSWNFMNLAALLLALGAGLDYSIHILIDLRRHDGNVRAVQSGVGRALLVCGLSSVAGFGSLAWASNLGLASLGQACAIALAINTAAAVFLLPRAWGWFPGNGKEQAS